MVCDSGGCLFPLLKADKPAKNGQFALFQLPVDTFLFVSFQGVLSMSETEWRQGTVETSMNDRKTAFCFVVFTFSSSKQTEQCLSAT